MKKLALSTQIVKLDWVNKSWVEFNFSRPKVVLYFYVKNGLYYWQQKNGLVKKSSDLGEASALCFNFITNVHDRIILRNFLLDKFAKIRAKYEA